MTPEQKRLVEEVNKVIVVTMDSVPGREIIEIKGLVEVEARGRSTPEIEVLLKKLAYEMGANAVVGIKVYSYSSGALVSPIYYGTAVVIK